MLTRSPRSHRWVFRLFLLAFFGWYALLGLDRPDSWSDASRLATIESLAERGTFAIDGSVFEWTGDRVRIAGRYYSHQPPMLALLAAPVVKLLDWLGFDLATDTGLYYRTLSLLFSALPLALCAALLRRALAARGEPLPDFLAGALLLGSLATPYALVLNHHLPAAAAVMIGLLPLLRGATSIPAGPCRASGAALGLAAALDPSAIAFAVLAPGIVLFRSRSASRTAQLLACALPPLLLTAWIHIQITGSPLPIGFHAELFEYPYSAFLYEDLTGALAGRPPLEILAYALRGTVGSFGLFAYHPWLLLGLAGAFRLAVRRGEERRDAAAITLLATAAIIGYYSLCSTNFGGACFGVRWYVVFVPALSLFSGAALQRLPGVWRPVLAIPLVLWSVAFAFVGSYAPWSRYNPFDRTREDRARDLELGRSRLEQILAEMDRVRALGPEFTEEFIHREFYRGMVAELERIEQRGETERGFEITAKLVATMPEDLRVISRAELCRARLWRSRSRPDEALTAVEKALRADPDRAEAHLLAAELLIQKGRFGSELEAHLGAVRRILEGADESANSSLWIRLQTLQEAARRASSD